MNSLSRMLQAVLWGVVTGGLLAFVHQPGESDPHPKNCGGPENSSPAIRLYRDPVCGTYVSPEISIKLEKSGQITHFCSAGCRERYGPPTARTARA